MKYLFSFIIIFFSLTTSSFAQHLWWNINNKPSSFLYGEITVLATHEGVYYAGANWFPGEPAGGYCGIQDNTPTERRTIFSIWDTAPNLKPSVTQADPNTIHNDFGGEGTGSHTHMVIKWEVGDKFRFFVAKYLSNRVKDSIDTKYYFYSKENAKWIHAATITSPIGTSVKSVSKFGGGLNSFLENFVGQNKEIPKLALYRLWLGDDLNNMTSLTQANGDGIWGEFNDSYFLAEGNNLQQVFALYRQFGSPTYGKQGVALSPISAKNLSPQTINELKNLPNAINVK